jgi:NAD(P)-dependent dehydrogenase (short-subunit alcohol dehydrogenase family)
VAEETTANIRAAGGASVACAGNVADWTFAADLVAAAVRAFGALDGFVNNAGIFHVCDPWDEEEGRVRELIEANVLGTLFCGTHALKQMVKQRRGSLVNVTSGAHAGISQMAAYGASKGAAASYTYSTAIDAMRYGVRVNAVSPLARTRMGAARRGASNSVGIPPEHTGPLITYLLSDLASGITGQIVRLQGPELCLVEHPIKLSPIPQREAWSVADIEEAFRVAFRPMLRPVGLSAALYRWEPDADA